MSDQADATATDAPEGTDSPDTEQPKPSETVDFWKQKARENEKRAKANAEAAKRLEEIEAASKTDAEKAAERLSALEREATEARADALRWKIAAKFQVSDEDADLFLTGTDEETLTRQAQRLTDRAADRKKAGNHVPNEGTTPPAKGDPLREFAGRLLAPPA